MKNIFDNAQIWDWVDSNTNNRERFEFTEGLTPKDVTSLIDLGCGHGSFLKLISSRRKDIRCVGIDNSDGALAYIPFEKAKASIVSVPFADKEFDCVYALEVLEHLNPEEFKKALEEMVRLSKKYIIVSVPYNEDLAWNMVKCPHCLTTFHYDGHLQVFNEAKIANLFAAKGFECIEQSRLGWGENFKFHKTYVKLFYSQQLNKTPHFTVCPVCNTELNPETPFIPDSKSSKGKTSILTFFKRAVKAFWPMEKQSYWIIGLYQKIDS
ncbi:MAG: class I SAM-dependent methyltransferase [Ginsengibacter sp.]